MLAVNKCREAFWIGNLKNRDIRGQEISSQISNREKGEDDDEEDEDENENEEEMQEEEKVRIAWKNV